jgi:hypothetical protein
MLRSIKWLYGHKLGALDGEIGQVKDFYFDDQKWAVRYVVADTGAWLPGRQVLLSPHAFGSLQEAGKLLPVNLTRKQIADSPPVELHKPVSRQYEDEYYRYYGWPCYWEGSGLWGTGDIPRVEPSSEPFLAEAGAANGISPEDADAHLRSTQAVNGYHIQATDGTNGHVCDFMMDDGSWAIRQLVVKTGHLFSGNEVRLPTRTVNWIDYKASKVWVNLTKETVEQSPVHDLSAVGAIE